MTEQQKALKILQRELYRDNERKFFSKLYVKDYKNVDGYKKVKMFFSDQIKPEISMELATQIIARNEMYNLQKPLSNFIKNNPDQNDLSVISAKLFSNIIKNIQLCFEMNLESATLNENAIKFSNMLKSHINTVSYYNNYERVINDVTGIIKMDLDTIDTLKTFEMQLEQKVNNSIKSLSVQKEPQHIFEKPVKLSDDYTLTFK